MGTSKHNNSITRVPKPQRKLHVGIFFSHEREITLNTLPQITCNIPLQRIQGANNKRIPMCHQKKGEMISSVEILDIGYTNSIGTTEIFLTNSIGTTEIFLKLKKRSLQELFHI
jgi:hypothetical protein